MKKITNKYIYCFLSIVFMLPVIIYFINSLLIGTLVGKSIEDFIIKFIWIIKTNITYYGTVGSITITSIIFIKNQTDRNEDIDKERKKEKKEREEKQEKEDQERRKQEKISNELREKELEQFKDKFRPTFILDKDNNYLNLILKDTNYYLENVLFSENDQIYYLGNLKANSAVRLNSNNNYFISGKTLIGEQIIFGRIFNNVNIYKALKENGSPIETKNIEENWINFNEVKKDINVDEYFINKTIKIREKIVFELTTHIKSIINETNIKDLLGDIFGILSTNKRDFQLQQLTSVIDVVMTILDENRDCILLNPKNIPETEWQYIRNKINIGNRCTEDKKYASSYLIKQYTNIGKYGIDNVLSVLNCFMKYIEFDNESLLQEKFSYYKFRIVDAIFK